jgi:hypothetical protein
MPTATSLRVKSLEQLLAQAGGSFGAKAPEIAGPAPAVYGVYAPAEANAQQALATSDPYFGPMHLANLGNEADNEKRAYEEQLRAQQEAVLQAQETAGYYGLQGKVFDKMPDDAPIGTFDVGPGANGHYGLKIDPVLSTAYNAVEFNGKTADQFKTTADGIAVLADKGYGLSLPDVSARLRNPLETPGSEVKFERYLTPANLNEQTRVSKLPDQEDRLELQRLINEGDITVAQLRTLASQGKVKATINPDDGTIQYTVTGDYNTVKDQAEGMSGVIRGVTPNPKAGVPGAGASATQGTNNFFTPERITSKKGMRQDPLGQGIRKHAGVDYRGKAGELYPAEGDGEVIDVGPKQGFGSNVVTVRYNSGETVFYGHGQRALVQKGQRVTRGQALGEVGSEGRSTGPHVHRQVVTAAHRNVDRTTPKPAQGVQMPQGVKASPINVILVTAQKHGADIKEEGPNIRVTLPDGRTRLYDMNGKVVG